MTHSVWWISSPLCFLELHEGSGGRIQCWCLLLVAHWNSTCLTALWLQHRKDQVWSFFNPLHMLKEQKATSCKIATLCKILMYDDYILQNLGTSSGQWFSTFLTPQDLIFPNNIKTPWCFFQMFMILLNKDLKYFFLNFYPIRYFKM